VLGNENGRMNTRCRILLLVVPVVLCGIALVLYGQTDCYNYPSWCWHDYEIDCFPTYSEECAPDYCSVYMCHTCYDETHCPDVFEYVFFCEIDNCAYQVCDGNCP
jgi:hypothetical protein